MGIKKLLTVATLLVAGGLTHNAWGQWEPIQPVDVTDKYLTNANFEGEYSNKISNNNGDRYIHQPNGWTVEYKNGNKYDSSMLDTKNDKYPTYGNLKTIFESGSDFIGNKAYTVRLHEGNNNQQILLSQNLGILEAGIYTVSAKFYTHNRDNLRVGFFTTKYENNNIRYNSGNGSWNDYSMTFESNGKDSTIIGIFFVHCDNTTRTAAVDNVTLSFISELDIAKNALSETIASVESLNTEENVGDSVFQIPSSAVTALTDAVDTAISARDANDATKESVEDADSVLLEAIETYNNVELNAPKVDTRYYVVLNNDNWQYDGKAMTFLEGDRNDQGNYNIKYNSEPNSNYAQAIIFKKANGRNCYTMSIMDVDGNQRYICTSKTAYNGSSAEYLRTTTDSTKALVVRINATETNGKFTIYNTEFSQYIGSKDSGVFTVNQNKNFKFLEATEASVDVKIAAGKYATRIFPFAVAAEDIPAGITVKSLSEVNGEKLILNDEIAIAPNVPYILYSEEGIETTLTGYGTAKQDTYETDFLTGVYGEGTVPVGSYVLQTQGGVQGFYKVVDEPVAYVPYRAYLADSSANAKAFFFGGDVTSINGVEGAEGAKEVVRYNAAGVKVNVPVKGLNIVKMSDGTVKKVMVK